MKDDGWNIQRVEGGFIVEKRTPLDEPQGNIQPAVTYSTRVFADSSALLNFLHNELAGSN